MTDFNALLSKPMDEIEKPKPLPVGSYLATLGQHKFDKAKNDKQTPFVSFPIVLNEPLPDVDQEQLTEALRGKQLSELQPRPIDQYLTDDAVWRLKEMLEHAGVEGGLPLGEAIQQAVGRQIVVHGEHKPSKDGTTMYWNITKTSAPPQ